MSKVRLKSHLQSLPLRDNPPPQGRGRGAPPHGQTKAQSPQSRAAARACERHFAQNQLRFHANHTESVAILCKRKARVSQARKASLRQHRPDVGNARNASELNHEVIGRALRICTGGDDIEIPAMLKSGNLATSCHEL